MVILQGEKEPFLRNIFTLNTCAPIVGSQVLSFDKESKLLEVCKTYIITAYLFFNHVILKSYVT